MSDSKRVRAFVEQLQEVHSLDHYFDEFVPPQSTSEWSRQKLVGGLQLIRKLLVDLKELEELKPVLSYTECDLIDDLDESCDRLIAHFGRAIEYLRFQDSLVEAVKQLHARSLLGGYFTAPALLTALSAGDATLDRHRTSVNAVRRFVASVAAHSPVTA